jgi:hypothetical protein
MLQRTVIARPVEDAVVQPSDAGQESVELQAEYAIEVGVAEGEPLIRAPVTAGLYDYQPQSTSLDVKHEPTS